MKSFIEILKESKQTVSANKKTYKLSIIAGSKGNSKGGKTFHILAIPSDESDIIAFKEPLKYVGDPKKFYLAQLGYTSGYDNGYDVPTQITPDLEHLKDFIKSEIIPALEGKNKEYTKITRKFPKNTKTGDIKKELNQ